MTWHVAIYDALAHVAVTGFVLLAIATVVLAAIRQPARRIRVIEMTLVGLLAIPFLALIPGYPRMAVGPAIGFGGDDENANADALIAAKRQEKNPPAQPAAIAPVPEMPKVEPPAGPADSPESIPSTPRRGNQPAAPIVNPQRGDTAHWQIPRDFRFWIVTGYLAGTGAMLAWSLVGLAAMARLLRSARLADDACRAVFREIGGPKSARVAILVSPRAGQPCALVWRRPTIVLPESLAAGGDQRQLRWALAHEWSHIARGDVWTWELSSVVRWFCFYQPLVWPLRRQLRLCQDYLADAAAARSGAAVEDYAEFLTSYSSRAKNPNLAAGLGIVGRASDLRRRIVMLVENRQPIERAVPRSWNLVVLPIAVLLVATVTSLGSRPAESAAEPPEAGSDDDPLAPQPGSAKPSARSEAEPGAQPKPQPQPKTLGGATPKRQPQLKSFTAAVEIELEKDPLILDLMRRLSAAQVQIPGLKNEAFGRKPESEGALRRLMHEIRAIEEQIDQRKAVLRPRLLDALSAAAQGSGQSATPSRATSSVPPFSGRIRPGDMLKIDLLGGFPAAGPPDPATVEPDGNVALGALYGGRVNVAGTTLSEAQEIIRKKLQEFLKDPQVQVTYEGRNRDVVPEGTAPPPTLEKQSEAKEPLQPLDTVEILLPQREMTRTDIIDGRAKEVRGPLPLLSGTYMIEPGGEISLPHDFGRVNVKGMSVRQAGKAVRDRLAEKMLTRTALPAVHVVKRGRAVFPEGREPPADYRIRKGDSLLIGTISTQDTFNYEVDAKGNLPLQPFNEHVVHVEGLTLQEAQEAVSKGWNRGVGMFGGGVVSPSDMVPHPYFLTLGGWREQADPDVIDQLEGNDQTRMQRLERELQEVKDLIRQLNR